jgi:hypothetical protein
VPPREITFTQTITAGAGFTVEKIETAIEKTLEAIAPKKRAPRKTTGSKKRGGKTNP